MSDLLTFVREHVEPQQTSDGQRSQVRVAANHLRRLLERRPAPEDLNREALTGVLELLEAEGRRQRTICTVRDSLLKICRAAVSAGLIDGVPTLPAFREAKPQKPQPWPLADLNLLLASARTMPGDVAGIPANLWWPALLLTMLDTGTSARVLIDTPRTAYDERAGTLAAGPFVYGLHPRVIEALALIRRHDQAELFPWPWDQQGAALYTLYRRMKQLLYRAGLPHVTRNLFDRLRVTAECVPQALDRVDLTMPFTPLPGTPRLPTSRERRNWDAITTPASAEPTWDSPPVLSGRRRPRGWQPPTIYRLQPIDDSRTLARFFEESYLPLRLAGKSQLTIDDYRLCINRFGWYLACEPTFDHLQDDLVEHFLAWLKVRPLAPATVNGYRAQLLALWRHAWRKKKVDEQPRDIPKLREPKRQPEAWSLEEVERILDAAAQEAGDVCGIPSGTWWVALILTLYDTGARIQAAMKARLTDFDPPWLKLPFKNQKQQADQSFELHPDTLSAIAATQPAGREMLFPWPYSMQHGTQTLQKRYTRILKRGGLPHGKRDKFHKLRRTSGTYLARETDEATAQRHLGHSSPTVTRMYIDPRKLKQTGAARLMERPKLRVISEADDVA